MLLFFIRHGDPIYDPDSLTPLGHRQAEAVAHRLARYGIDKIYSSTSTRAMQTAEPTCELLKKEMVTLDWCHEDRALEQLTAYLPNGRRTWAMRHPDFMRKFNSEEVRALGLKWYEHPYFADTKFKEGIERVQRETDALIASHGYRHDHEQHLYIPENPNEERIALFAHEGFGAIFTSCLLDIPYPIFSTHVMFTHSSMTVFEFREVDGIVIPNMLTSSNDSHLYADNLPTKYQNRVYF